MITVYFLNSLGLWIIQWILQMIVYFFLLKKMYQRTMTTEMVEMNVGE